MSNKRSKIDSALGIDIDKIIEDADQDVNFSDKDQIEKYNERRKEIDTLKQNLKDARVMKNTDWAEALLKVSAEKMMIAQGIFTQEIEDDPASKNITALAELGNALVNTVNAVQDVEREERKLVISQEKNDLRRKEIEINSGEILDVDGNGVVAIGTGQDLLALIHNNIDPLKIKHSQPDTKEEKEDASTKEG
jgi:hypothetical protein